MGIPSPTDLEGLIGDMPHVTLMSLVEDLLDAYAYIAFEHHIHIVEVKGCVGSIFHEPHLGLSHDHSY